MAVIAVKVKKPLPFLVEVAVRIVKTKPLGAIGGFIVLLMLVVGFIPDLVATHSMVEIHSYNVLEAPSAQFRFGTDHLGRDIFSRVVHGARTSMIVGLAVPLVNLVISLTIGGISGFVGGKTDMIVQRFVDAWICFPGLIITITVMSLIGAGMLQLICILGFSGGIASSRTIRSAVIGMKENVYIKAAKAIGSSPVHVIRRHILPNIMPVILILFTLHMGGAILAEAALSFLGYGIPPPAPSWGGMLSGESRRYMEVAPWMALFPGLALSIVVYGISMLGDALRDILDPRLRGGLGRYGKAVKVKVLKTK